MSSAAVVFDMDGTLLRLPVDIVAARLRLAAYFHDLGVDVGFNPVLAGIRSAARLAAKASGRDVDVLEREGRDILDGFEVAASRTAVSREGAAFVIGALRRRGVLLGLVTDNGRACVDPALTKVGLSPGVFRVVSTRDDVDLPKPHPQGLVRVAMVLGRANLWYVGDHVKDMETVRAARVHVPGLRAAGLIGGVSPREELLASGADQILERLEDVLSIPSLG